MNSEVQAFVSPLLVPLEAHSIGEATRYIRDGLCDVMVTGGAESSISPLTIAGFSSMRALSTRNDDPQSASRPWDVDRDGFICGEASGVLILEDYEHAAKRGAHIYCELSGYGASSDAFHITKPTEDGSGPSQAMHYALKDSGLNRDEIDYINAHGTSTPAGDGIEHHAIKSVFKHHSPNLFVSSTKSMTGHTLGAAGAIESIFSIKALEDGIVPPTINLDNPSPGLDLNLTPHVAIESNLRHALNNSFGFGGTNSCLVFSKI